MLIYKALTAFIYYCAYNLEQSERTTFLESILLYIQGLRNVVSGSQVKSESKTLLEFHANPSSSAASLSGIYHMEMSLGIHREEPLLSKHQPFAATQLALLYFSISWCITKHPSAFSWLVSLTLGHNSHSLTAPSDLCLDYRLRQFLMRSFNQRVFALEDEYQMMSTVLPGRHIPHPHTGIL